MTYGLREILLTAFVLLATGCFADANEQCSPLKQLASAEMGTLPSGLVYLPMSIAGHSENFIVATNDIASFIRASTAIALGLPRSKIRDIGLSYGKIRLEDYATAQPTGVGQIQGAVRFAVVPDGNSPADVAGTIGLDFLQNFDVEFDFAKGKINFFSPKHCSLGVVYWTRDTAARIPIRIGSGGAVQIDALLDDKSADAQLSTGSTRSAGTANYEDFQELAKPEHWTSISEVMFQSISLDGILINHPNLLVNTVTLHRIVPFKPRLFIGMDILRQLHLYFAFKEGNLYVTSASAQ